VKIGLKMIDTQEEVIVEILLDGIIYQVYPFGKYIPTMILLSQHP